MNDRQTDVPLSATSLQADPVGPDEAHGDYSCLVLDQVANLYLDANATVAPLPEVADRVAATMRTVHGNPSSVHWLGAEARAVLERARDDVVSLVGGALPEGVVFTSGGTEGNNVILASLVATGRVLITSRVEHASILEPARRHASRASRAILLDVSQDGVVDPGAVADALASTETPVCLSLQWANSETGVIQPVAEIVAEARRVRPDVLIHSDIAQAIGRVSIDLDVVPVDVVTFSGHKLHGPQGTGAMVLRDPTDPRLRPLLFGGGQEHGWRAGTQNVAGCAGLGLAARTRAGGLAAIAARLGRMRDAFEQAILASVPDVRVNGATAPRVPNTSNLCFRGIDGMRLLALLDAKGVACSAGSACSAARPEPSHVLTAMGLSEHDAFSSLRFSFSVLNTGQEVSRAAALVAQAVGEAA